MSMVDKMMDGAPCLRVKTPNYAIKRDLRGNIRYIRIVIRRVGPLFWLLGGVSKKQNKVSSSLFFLLLSV